MLGSPHLNLKLSSVVFDRSAELVARKRPLPWGTMMRLTLVVTHSIAMAGALRGRVSQIDIELCALRTCRLGESHFRSVPGVGIVSFLKLLHP